MRPAINHEKLWRTVKDNLTKSDAHLKLAGKALLELKLDHDAQGGTWAQWEALVKDRAGIGKSRASELMRIAGGKTTAEEVRADTAERTAKAREQSSPLRSGENGGDSEASAETMKAKFAALDAATVVGEAECARDDRLLHPAMPSDLHRPSLEPIAVEDNEADLNPLVAAWAKASPKLRSEFVGALWDEIKEARTGIPMTAIYGNGGADEGRWIEG